MCAQRAGRTWGLASEQRNPAPGVPRDNGLGRVGQKDLGLSRGDGPAHELARAGEMVRPPGCQLPCPQALVELGGSDRALTLASYREPGG